MKAAIIVFPGTNREHDMAGAIVRAGGAPTLVWHGEATLPEADLIVLPGGFAHGDYLRCGAMAARSPIMGDVIRKAGQGVPTLGVCNGFQVLTEAGLLPGALMRNAGLKFICRDVMLRVSNADTRFTRAYAAAQVIRTPMAHHDGNYFADDATLDELEGENRVVFRYDGKNLNGSRRAIAGIVNQAGNVMGMMPHPENMTEAALGGRDGCGLFDSLMGGAA